MLPEYEFLGKQFVGFIKVEQYLKLAKDKKVKDAILKLISKPFVPVVPEKLNGAGTAPRLELCPVALPEVLPVILYSTNRLATLNFMSLMIKKTNFSTAAVLSVPGVLPAMGMTNCPFSS